mmetsp:Transcript_14575/g.21984  ORF Transcript_14575/g.21984 Transcript_14575/m.21984 type:complete len:101 (-) Transcript_14575:1089-1391(-)
MIHDAGATALAIGAPCHNIGLELETTVRIVITLDNFKETSLAKWTWDAIHPKNWHDELLLKTKRHEAEAAIFFTTGSTSRPKPVLHMTLFFGPLRTLSFQ